jgi:glyoxylase-like metal-dependent hydrolase (beta-lactamase superfamily II)
VLFDSAEGWLFSGDQLLPEITPTPAIQASPLPALPHAWRFHSLPNFLDSMLRIRDLEATKCWPGHGEPFANVGDVIAENIAQIEQRTERVLAALKLHGAASAYALAADLYPRALARRFWQIVATVQGHLDLLEERALVAEDRGIYSPAR